MKGAVAMKHHRFVLVSGLSLPVILALFVGVRVMAQSEVVHWRGDFEQARGEAKRTGKPLFVVFR